MEVSLPSAWDADATPEREITLDESFAHSLGQLMTGLISPEEAVTEWARACDQEARRIYKLSQDLDHSSRVQHEEELQELRDECDTWGLIAHLFSSDDPVSGPCPVSVNPSDTPGYGKMTSFMQQALAVTMSHVDLRRVAQLVAWLEDQSMRELVLCSTGHLADSLEEFGATAGYTRQEAIQKLRASSSVSELPSQDPDASSWNKPITNKMGLYRQIRAEVADHRCVSEDQQLLSAVYTLLRAGAEPMAANLCIKAACSWRAATMCATGWGLLPVGESAATDDSSRNVQSQHTAIAADILAQHGCSDDLSSGHLAAACAVRERWRAACAAAAAAAAQRSGSGTAGAIAATYERAIFGVLAGSAEHCQVACTSWQDRLWVWGRAVLQSEPEQRLLEDKAATPHNSRPLARRLRPWEQQALFSIPAQPSSAPDARRNGLILEQAKVLLDEIEAVEGGGARLHHSVQRLLAKAALEPLSMMQMQVTEHPLREVFERMLSVAQVPGMSPSMTQHRVRFAAHLGLALVSLGAVPGNPADTEHLWRTFSDCLPGHLLEAINHVIDVYVGTLTRHPDGIYRELLPQYICLLRPSLTNVTLRRCFTVLMPGPDADAYQRSQDGTAILANQPATREDIRLVSEPPAAECITQMLSPEAWHEGSILLETLLHWFRVWHCDVPGAAPPPSQPHLPRTTVRFDAVLCETVREAVRSTAISNIDRLAMVKWLLLPFQMRKDMLEPFLGAEGAIAHACWICTVQAIFLSLDICRQSAIRGVAYQYAAYALLQHILGTTYASHMSSAFQQDTDEDIDTVSHRSLLDAVSARCELLEQQEESQLLIALQRAIRELQEWHEILSAMDQLARFSRAVTAAANGVLLGPSVADALSAVASVGSRELLSGSCYVPQAFSGDIGIELLVCTCYDPHDDAQPVRDVWGSSAAIDVPAGMPESEAIALASDIAMGLNARLHASATWRTKGLSERIGDSIEVTAAAETMDVVLTPSERQPQAAVRFSVTLSGAQVRTAANMTDQPQAFSDAAAVCLDVIATSITDLLRGDLLDHDSTGGSKSGLEVLAACALAPRDTWESSMLVLSEDSTRGVHAAHVHGDTLGRFSLLRALAGRMVLADLAMASSRLHLWAAQLAIKSDTLSDVWAVRDGLEGCGICVSERALEVMSTSQIREVLANTQLALLHDGQGHAVPALRY